LKDKRITLEAVRWHFFDGMTLMVGGFMGTGTPLSLVKAFLDSGVMEVTLIATDTARIDAGVGPIIAGGQVKKLFASHIGTNPETGRRMLSGELLVELVPQGTVAERIRCGGSGLGGVLTPTGVGTVVEKEKRKIELGGIEYLLETPLRADVALLKARTADRMGNLTYELSARNFNPVMALAANIVIAECDRIVEIGDIDPETVITPGAVVDYLYCEAQNDYEG
jgi:acetate CoA/acetoacetate CoA-transferase alpha subunit